MLYPDIKSKSFGFVLFLFIVPVSCRQQNDFGPESDAYALQIPKGFPDMPVPADNLLTKKRVQLGRQLFYDPILSWDSTISCATCHIQHLAFGQDIAIPVGTSNLLGKRNAPTLGNIGYHPYYLREGGVPTLEQQVSVPVQELHEFGTSFPEIVVKLRQSSVYTDACLEAYNREPEAYCVTRALAAFQRTLITGNSQWDKYFYQGNVWAVDASVKRGWQVFNEVGCADCHSGFNFTDYQFYNIGLYVDYPDPGRNLLTGKESDIGSFKTPSLRNIAVSSPYMHDGSIETLGEVIDHFSEGGHPHPNKSSKIQTFELIQQQREDLLLFLRSLTDTQFLSAPEFGKP